MRAQKSHAVEAFPKHDVTAIGAGDYHKCGSMYSWGANDYAQLGINSKVATPTPTPVVPA